jgi:GntR family transcriptional repressor for pyruvate dehydrogenase complex
MAQQLADTLTEEIVTGRRQPGDALPTEPELAREFEVSRSVVRDATRMLAARGLVSVQHGRGAFVTESQLTAFGDALLLALRREHASVWDVEEFFERFWPEAFAMAAERATDDELALIETRAESHIETFAEVGRQAVRSDSTDDHSPTVDPQQLSSLRDSFAEFTEAILAATHNKLFALLAAPIQRLRSLRSWDLSQISLTDAVELEAQGFRDVVAALRSRNAGRAREAIARWFELPAEAVRAMKRTPVGDTVEIPVGFEVMSRRNTRNA